MQVNPGNAINFIQQSTSRFLNAIASFNIGRTYLTSGPIVLNMVHIIDLIINNSIFKIFSNSFIPKIHFLDNQLLK